ncbi:hypothetical protein [Acrocarpospora catenulata]|uniref:hypothetical protein n=1 Tax=Acrocarpospora catenulata TaxID=2836182 RepID=UPI001BDB4342|nr:hypothetical protein [Acrocarpospora catenulata]
MPLHVVVGYGTDFDLDVNLDVIRAWWSLRSLLAVRWLVKRGFDSSISRGAPDVSGCAPVGWGCRRGGRG